MMKSPFEAEVGVSGEVDASTLRRPLLSDDFLDDGDESILTQLISTSGRSERHITRRRQLIRGRRVACSFVVLSLVGLVSSAWTTFFACDLVAVRYPAGGVQLLVTAFGIWSYQQKIVQNNRNGNADDKNKRMAMTKTCVDYDRIQKNHQDVDLKDFFPVNTTIQAYAIVSFSFYIAAMMAIFIFLLIVLAHPEVFSGSESVSYPATGMTSSVTSAACFFLVACVFHSLLMYRLLHFSENGSASSSSICSPAHSHCHLGLGGYWVVFALSTSFVSGIVASVAAHKVRRVRAGRSTRFC